MKITVLVDNISNDAQGLKAEHGLSFFMQADERKFLVDVGATSLFIENACKLGVDIADVDYLILSHAHADHTGGLEAFLSINSKAKIYLSENVCGRNFFSTRRGVKRNISIDHRLLQLHEERFIFVNKNTSVTENVKLISAIPCIYSAPKANATLFADNAPDDFLHELAVVVKNDNGSASVISPCTHRGILNILDAVKNYNVSKFVGGLHLLDSDEKNSFESVEEIQSLAHEILKRNIFLCTGHCTGINAKNILSKELGNNFAEFYTGFSVNL
ncbi:MAG: MBL fold metallo-hydrolase [Bacteroidales bacterium]|nr:MBL fold metallo-hydrolase [Bacteroidales bacterium]